MGTLPYWPALLVALLCQLGHCEMPWYSEYFGQEELESKMAGAEQCEGRDLHWRRKLNLPLALLNFTFKFLIKLDLISKKFFRKKVPGFESLIRVFFSNNSRFFA